MIPCEIEVGEKQDSIQSGIKNKPSDYIKQFWSPKISLQEGIKRCFFN